MSFDLYFIASGDAPSPEAFRDWSASRRHYQFQGKQAFYANEDTGAYFAFELVVPEEDADPEDPAAGAWATFNLNYGRPRFFQREAAIELAAFVGAFGGEVLDPQIGGGRGRFDAERFAASWSKTNAFSYETFARRGGAAIDVAGELLDATWEWNYGRDELLTNADLFVPKVQFLLRDRRVGTFQVWTDGIPGAVPRTDFVVVARKRPGAGEDAPLDTFLVPFARIEPVLAGLAKHATPLEHWRPADGIDERRVVAFLASLAEPSPRGEFSLVAPDRIRDLGAVAAPKPSLWRRLLGR